MELRDLASALVRRAAEPGGAPERRRRAKAWAWDARERSFEWCCFRLPARALATSCGWTCLAAARAFPGPGGGRRSPPGRAPGPPPGGVRGLRRYPPRRRP